jgi:uncharacterized membrane protein
MSKEIIEYGRESVTQSNRNLTSIALCLLGVVAVLFGAHFAILAFFERGLGLFLIFYGLELLLALTGAIVGYFSLWEHRRRTAALIAFIGNLSFFIGLVAWGYYQVTHWRYGPGP